MTLKRGRRSRDRATMLIRSLQTALESLPSQEEKQQLLKSLDLLRGFIDELRDSVVRVPTGENVNDTRAALEKLEQVYVKATSSPWLAATLGIERKKKSGTTLLSGDEMQEGKRLAQRLAELPTDQVEADLLDESQYPSRSLRAVAQAFGIRSTKGFSRESLAHQIAVKTANARGYKALRGESQG